MNQDEPEEFKLNDFKQQIQRVIFEKPLNLKEEMDPTKLTHNKIARMVQHDVRFVKSKVIPEPADTRLKIMANPEYIHGKLFA